MKSCFNRINNIPQLNAHILILKRTIFDSNKITNQASVSTIKNVRDGLKKLVGFSAVYTKSDADKSLLDAYKITNQSELAMSRMSQSYDEALIPLEKEPLLRERYVNAFQNVRFGRLLEDLDTMAVHVSYLHNKGQCLTLNNQSIAPIVIVTALVDRIEVKKQEIAIDKDLKISGYTSWVGKSSSETTMKLEQEVSPNNWVHILDAKFLVCARDIFNKGSAIMSPLELVTDEEKRIFAEGEASKLVRQKEIQQSLFNVPPNEIDSKIVHEIFKETIDLKSGSLQQRVIPPDSIRMEDAKVKNIVICHPEQRNIYNKIFGGFLMRKGFELGWINACMFSESLVDISVVDDITFRRPVIIGSLLFLSSQVVYTQGNSILVKVFAEAVEPLTKNRYVTNEFYFKFASSTKPSVPRVIPKSYSEAMIYLDGKRHW